MGGVGAPLRSTTQTLEAGRFLGREARSARLGGITLVETAYDARESLASHRHTAPYFCLVLGGSFEEQAGLLVRECRSTGLTPRAYRRLAR